MEIETKGIFDITVICSECYAELPSTFSNGDLEVSLCPECFSNERRDGYNEGLEDGKELNNGGN